MLDQGKFQESAEWVLELSRQADYGEKRWTDPFFPACDLNINLEDEAGAVRNYVHFLDYSTGLASVTWQDERGELSRRVFVSRADEIAVLQLSGAAKGKITCEIGIEQHPPDSENDYWAGSDKFLQGLTEPFTQVEAGWLYFRGCFRRNTGGYECLARVIQENGTQSVSGNNLRIENSDAVLVILQLLPLAPEVETQMHEMKTVLAALPADFDTLLSRHVEIHSPLFNRVCLEMGDSQALLRPAEVIWQEARQGTPSPAYFQQIFDAGRYEILSSCGEWAPNLQGVWSGIYGVPWSSDYTQNGNVQTAIAGLLSGNLPECMESYLRYLEFLVEDSRVNARAFYGCRGILLASRTSSHGQNNHFDSTWPMTFWTASAGWGAHFFYDTWLHTCDDSFFLNRTLPYMKEVAEFYEDFLVEDEDGHWCFTPSYSPENHPGNSNSQACVNATMDIAVARELFNNLLTGCRTLGVETENLDRWGQILAKMPPYLVNADGAAKEWCDLRLEDRYDHRHASHLYPLMYGVARELSQDPKLLAAFAKAYQLKIAERVQEANVMAFGSVQMGQAALHLGDREIVWRILQHLASGYYFRNFATSHDQGPSVFNADLSGGMPALILEAFMQSEVIQDQQGSIAGYRLHVLPALPKPWQAGRIEGMLTRGGFFVDLEWESGALTRLIIRNPHGKACSVRYQSKEIQLADFVETHLTGDLSQER